MRIGLCSDVHGNLAGLRAVAEALAQEGELDHIIVAGDHLGGGPRPREVWKALAASGWTLLRGNEDEVLATEPAAGEPNYPPDFRFRASYLGQLAWTRHALDQPVLRRLASLPAQYRLATPAGELLVVHSSPRDANDRSGGPHNTAEEVTQAYGGSGATAIAFGHFHQSFVRLMPFALLINVASVGLPRDGRPLAAYTILTATSDGWIVEQRRVPYDPAEELTAAAATGMPAWIPDPVPGASQEQGASSG